MKIHSIVTMLLLGQISAEKLKQIDATEFAITETSEPTDSTTRALAETEEGTGIESESESGSDSGSDSDLAEDSEDDKKADEGGEG